MEDKTFELLDKLIQERLERLPRGIRGKAPMKNLESTCDEIDTLKNIKDLINTSRAC